MVDATVVKIMLEKKIEIQQQVGRNTTNGFHMVYQDICKVPQGTARHGSTHVEHLICNI